MTSLVANAPIGAGKTILARRENLSRSWSCPATATLSYDSRSYSYIAFISVSTLALTRIGISQHTFPGSLEEEPHDENLQPSHANHQPALYHAEVKDPALCTLNGAEVAVLAGPEVFLVAIDGGKVSRYFHDGLLQSGGLFRGGALFGG